MEWTYFAIGFPSCLPGNQSRAAESGRVVTDYYKRALFGGDGGGGELILAQVDRAGAAQKRGEVARLAVQFQNLGMKLGDEGGRRHLLPRGDVVKDPPERPFQTDRGRLPVQPQAAGDGFIAVGVLPREDLAHGLDPKESDGPILRQDRRRVNARFG